MSPICPTGVETQWSPREFTSDEVFSELIVVTDAKVELVELDIKCGIGRGCDEELALGRSVMLSPVSSLDVACRYLPRRNCFSLAT